MIDIRKERPLSIKRVAAVMDVDRRTIERWFTLGLERIKLGGKVYTSKAALYRFSRQETQGVERERVTPAAERAADEYLDRIGV